MQHYSGAGPGQNNSQAATNAFGRGLFRMHGGSIAHPGQASESCIIPPPDVRRQMSALPGRTLTVTQC